MIPSLFATGQREISPTAESALFATGIDPEPFFARHASGDWGEVEDWLRRDNDHAASYEAHSHVIRSLYPLDAGREILVVTDRDRSRTRIMLKEEFKTREVGLHEGYAVWANTYEGIPNPLIAVEEPVVEAILSALPPFETAMDVGTGTGRLARKLAHHGASRVLGVDTSLDMLAVAREKAWQEGLHHLHFERANVDGEPLPAASDSFDLLTCGLMLCHVADLRGALHECVRVVRPGGWLILTDFHPSATAFGWRTDIVTLDGVFFLPNPPHAREEYLHALAEAGCLLHAVQDVALDGTPFGDVSEAAIKMNGVPPLCLVILAQKQAPIEQS